MWADSYKNRFHLCFVVISVVVLVVCVFFLAWFMLTKPASASDAA